MFKRKLLALEHQKPEEFNIENESEFRNMFVWLEDQKIRHYKIEDRAALRNTSDDSVWLAGAKQYLNEVNCPYPYDDGSVAKKCAVIDWLLGYAVRLEYGENIDKYKDVTPQTVQSSAKKASGASNNPLDNLDFDDPDFKAGVTSLSMLLKVPPHSDHIVMLNAIGLLVKSRIDSLKTASKDKAKEKDELIPISQTVLGFETKDYIINEAAKIIRLLHIKELRDLQNNINSAIVSVQAITADPRTDQKLGKVGRG